jgi:integrase
MPVSSPINQGCGFFCARKEPGMDSPKTDWRKQPRKRAGTPPADLKLLRSAAKRFAGGERLDDIAKAMGLPKHKLPNLRSKNQDVWDAAYNQAMAANVEKVRAIAGTDAILENPLHYFEAANRAEKWARGTGSELFPSPPLPTDRQPIATDYTLTTFLENYFLPVCGGELSPQSINLYRLCIRRWKYMMGEPRLHEINNELMARFRDVLIVASNRFYRKQKLSANTVRMYMRMVQIVLDKAGPPGPRRRDAAGLLPVAPWAKPPRSFLRKVVTVDESVINRCYEAATLMELPVVGRTKPAHWWRALLVVSFNLGLRSRTIFSLRWEHFKRKERVLDIPASILKGRRDLILPVPDVVFDHLCGIDGDRELIFEWPGCLENFRKHFHKLQRLAGLRPDEFFGLHTLRRTAATNLWKVDPAAAQLTLGHSSINITRDHYANAREVLGKAMDSIPQPESFSGKGGETL